MIFLLKNGKKVNIRKPKVNDAESIINVMSVTEYENKVIGQCSVGLGKRNAKYRHRAEVPFVILKDYCNLGIGGKMME